MSYTEKLYNAIKSINDNYGRGNVEAVTVHNDGNGWVTRFIPTTQRDGFTEKRRFTLNQTTLTFLGRKRKVYP